MYISVAWEIVNDTVFLEHFAITWSDHDQERTLDSEILLKENLCEEIVIQVCEK